MHCQDCQAILVPDLPYEKPFKSSFVTLKFSARAGCTCCAFLQYCIESHVDFDRFELAAIEAAPVMLNWYEFFVEANYCEEGGATVSIKGLRGDGTSDRFGRSLKVELEFYTSRDTPSAKAWPWSDSHPIPADPLSEYSMNMVSQWIDECCSSHAGCHPTTSDILPSRIIDLAPLETHHESRLVDTSTISGLSGNYATLSHCWGQVERTTSTTGTIAQMRDCIPLSSLSPTYRDAVLVAKKLKFRYLWIDSICIVQDSSDDWNRESAKMAGIFANSGLTIAGPASRNSQQAFLTQRAAGMHTVQLAEPMSHFHLRKKIRSFKEEIQDAPLNQRAWVFQEIQLSRRILYFGVDKIIWRCREKWAREDTTNGFNLAFQSEVYTLYEGQKAVKRQSKHYGGSLLHRSNWYPLVNEYSGKQLTYQSDKLPALSAIAQEIQRLTGDTYVAGLWKEDLIHGLLWMRQEIRVEKKDVSAIENSDLPSWDWDADDKPVEIKDSSVIENSDVPSWNWADDDCPVDMKDFPATENSDAPARSRPANDNPVETKDFSAIENSSTPSWSWAAYTGLVDTHNWRSQDCDFQELASVEEVAVELVNETYPTGSVLGGTIVLRGLCQQFLFSRKDAVSDVTFGTWDATRMTVLLPSNGKAELEIVFDLETEWNAVEPAVYLLMAKHNDYDTKFFGFNKKIHMEAQAYCLILRASNVGLGQYKRVGVGVIEGNCDLDGSTGWEERTVTVV